MFACESGVMFPASQLSNRIIGFFISWVRPDTGYDSQISGPKNAARYFPTDYIYSFFVETLICSWFDEEEQKNFFHLFKYFVMWRYLDACPLTVTPNNQPGIQIRFPDYSDIRLARCPAN